MKATAQRLARDSKSAMFAAGYDASLHLKEYRHASCLTAIAITMSRL